MQQELTNPKLIQRTNPGVWAVFDSSGSQVGTVRGGKGYYRAICDGKQVGDEKTKNAAARLLIDRHQGAVSS